MDKVLRDTIHKLERQVGVQIERACSDAQDREYAEMIRTGKQLPMNVYEDKENPGEFVQIHGTDMTAEERSYVATLQMVARLQAAIGKLEIANQYSEENIKMLRKIKFWIQLPVILAICCAVLRLFGIWK